VHSSVPVAFVALASCGALLVYHFDRALLHSPEDALNAPERLEWLKRHSWWVIGSTALSAVVVSLSAIDLGWDWVPVAVVLGGIGIGYSIRMLPGGRRPKDVPYLKSLLIASCWVGGGAIFPVMLVSSHAPDASTVLLFGVYRLLYIAPNVLAADMYDRHGDHVEGISGVGSHLSMGTLRKVSVLCGSLAVSVAIIMMSRGVAVELLVVDLIGVVGLVVTIWVLRMPRAGHISVLDLWAGFPALTWLFSLFLS